MVSDLQMNDAASSGLAGAAKSASSDPCSQAPELNARELTEAIIAELERRECDTGKPAEVRRFLKKLRVDTNLLKALSRAIVRWKRASGNTNEKGLGSISNVLLLAKILGFRLLGPQEQDCVSEEPRQAIDERDTTIEKWLVDFMATCTKLSCYIAYADTEQLSKWRKSVTSARLTNAQLIEYAEQWTRDIEISHASRRLLDDHEIELDPRPTMHHLIQQRLEWIRLGDSEAGHELARLAACEIYGKIAAVVKNNQARADYRRYPAMHKQEDGQTALRSLRVSFDSVPRRKNSHGWVIYYFWGPQLRDEVLADLRSHAIAAASETPSWFPMV